jgi:hypothetical protein
MFEEFSFYKKKHILKSILELFDRICRGCSKALLTLRGARENTHHGARGLDRTSLAVFALGPS